MGAASLGPKGVKICGIYFSNPFAKSQPPAVTVPAPVVAEEPDEDKKSQ